METGINISNAVSKETTDNLKDVITAIFTVGHRTHMEPSVLVEALRIVGGATKSRKVVISDTTISDYSQKPFPVYNQPSPDLNPDSEDD